MRLANLKIIFVVYWVSSVIVTVTAFGIAKIDHQECMDRQGLSVSERVEPTSFSDRVAYIYQKNSRQLIAEAWYVIQITSVWIILGLFASRKIYLLLAFVVILLPLLSIDGSGAHMHQCDRKGCTFCEWHFFYHLFVLLLGAMILLLFGGYRILGLLRRQK